jgi:hypothetical protein
MVLIQYKRNVHTCNLLVLAQELGEILAISHNRHVNNMWLEKDREVIFFYFIINMKMGLSCRNSW